MAALKDVNNTTIRKALADSNHGKPVLAINGAGATSVKTTNALTYTSDGVYYTKAALAAQSVAVTHDRDGNAVSASGPSLAAYVQPTGTTVYYLLAINAAGTIAVVQGDYAGQSGQYPDLQRTVNGTGNVPPEPAGYVAFGLLKVATANGATFTPGTTALDAANVTVTYFDLKSVPSVAP